MPASLPIKSARQLRAPEIDRLVASYRAGATVYQLADEFGIHRSTVGRHLQARGVDTRLVALGIDDLQLAIQLYQQGWSLIRLAKEFGVAESTVWLKLREAGVVMRRPWERV